MPGRLLGLFAALDSSHIRWCLLRPRELLTQSEGDIDVLVPPAQLGLAGEVLERQGFLSMGADGANRHALDRDDESGRFIWIHVQTSVSIAGGSLPAADLLASARDDQLPQPSALWLFWILALRGLLEKSQVPARHREHLRSMAGEAGGAPEAVLRLARAHALDPERVVAVSAAGDWPALEALRSDHAASPPGRSRLALHRGVNLIRGVTSVALSRKAGPRGLSVAVLGPDGAGKTTLVTTLAASLPLTTRIVYLGLTGGRIYRADKLRLPGLVFLARAAVLWSRYLRGTYYRSRGQVVLFERYVLDATAPSGVPLRPIARLSRRLQRWVLPLPDLVLLLDASGTTLHRRSREYDAERLEQWRVAFRRLEQSVKQLEVLDAERPAEVVLGDAQARIWRRYRDARRQGGTPRR